MTSFLAAHGKQRSPMVKESRSCAGNGSQMNFNCKLQLFQAAGPLDSVAIDILGPLLIARLAYQPVVIMIDSDSELLQSITSSKLHHCIS